MKYSFLEFDEHKSQASMPRLYEHIDRVDLWIMAQKKYQDKNSAIFKQLIEIIEEQRHIIKKDYSYINCTESCNLGQDVGHKCKCGFDSYVSTRRSTLAAVENKLKEIECQKKQNI